ncbi:MAG: hypothetical protein KGP28_05415 [Bdellovibrionales bacterium]|nr:hypothetical protein [Bdellovibrionales bacterium]
MKNFAFIVLSSLFLVHASHAEKMENGCEITESIDTQGNPAYQVESQGRTVYWLKQAESGYYTNFGDVDHNGTITNSDAVNACAKKGLNLPSKEDFDALQLCFEATVSNPEYLSDKGLDQMINGKGDFKGFKDMANKEFWSSSVHTDHQKFAFGFSCIYGYGVYGGYRGDPHFVRCVGR